jgi:hypothetical protein
VRKNGLSLALKVAFLFAHKVVFLFPPTAAMNHHDHKITAATSFRNTLASKMLHFLPSILPSLLSFLSSFTSVLPKILRFFPPFRLSAFPPFRLSAFPPFRLSAFPPFRLSTNQPPSSSLFLFSLLRRASRNEERPQSKFSCALAVQPGERGYLLPPPGPIFMVRVGPASVRKSSSVKKLVQ